MNLPWWFPFGKVDEWTAQELDAKIRSNGKDLQLIDVRTMAEYTEGHIAKTRNVPIQTLPQRIPELMLDLKRPVVAICLSGHRSVPAYRLLKRAGFTQVYQLAGGMMAWRHAGLPTVKDGR